jgi:hypothetical protein
MPLALLSIVSIFGNEAVEEANLSEQKEENCYERVSLGFDMFWSHSSYKRIYSGYHYGCYQSKSTDTYEGLRFTWEKLKPNALYIGSDIWLAAGDSHQKIYIDHEKVRDKDMSTNIWFNMDGGFGYNFQPSFAPRFLLSVFAGPGYHFERKFHSNADWGYVMAGFKIAQDLTESLSLGADFKTMYTFVTRDPHGVTSLERKAERQFWGIEMGTPVTWHIGEKRKVDLQFKPYLLKWNLNSPATAIGFKVALGYSF